MISVEFDFKKTQDRIKDAAKIGQYALAQQVLKDANRYVKKDSGVLEASSIKYSQLKKGNLIWRTAYAKKQYYLSAASKDVNPKASKMWAHKAKSRHSKQWHKILQKVIRKEV